ncbi:MAG: glycosyltransferase family 4 protein [Verrucomicrobiales bacterium]|nr:glycosyltransferase family 4 protein [Verrucomicrobiales bacterium]
MSDQPRIVYITAGAGGMYCGSCIRDNSLAAGLGRLGWDVTLLPLYTPIRVDEEDNSVDQVFFGGLNVYLQQKIPLFRHLPAFVDRWLDHPKLIRRVASKAVNVSASELGDMTLSMVRGEHGHQAKEVKRLVHWLKEHGKPDLICLTNLLVGGSIPALKRELGIPVLVTLQGDDVFLDELQEPWRAQVLAEMKQLAAQADGFITFSSFYRKMMCEMLEVPEEKFDLTPLGVDVSEFDSVLNARSERERGKVIGYFARLSPEKGLHHIVDAFISLADDNPEVRLKIGGWLSPKDREFYEEQVGKISTAGLEDRFEHIEAPDGEAKLEFLKQIDVFCVPAEFVEPKGLYLLEAMACGLPVVAPDQGALSEMVQASGAGRLFEHGDANDLRKQLETLLNDNSASASCGASGRKWVESEADQPAMARATAEVFQKVLAEK